MLKSVFRSLANNTFVQSHVSKAVSDPNYAARALVMANVAKDTIGCVFYTYQSLNNDKIPEKKRKFVAALDLANGFLMCITQFILGFTISHPRIQNKIGNRLFHGLEEGLAKRCRAGFAIMSSLVISTIVAKRLIVPFIATPVATWVKTNVIDKTAVNK